MIPTLGLMLATYAIARLVQVPMEMYAPDSVRWVFATVVSVLAIGAILVLSFSLVMSGLSTDIPALR